jgi:hypothetical protein
MLLSGCNSIDSGAIILMPFLISPADGVPLDSPAVVDRVAAAATFLQAAGTAVRKALVLVSHSLVT